MFGLTDDHDTYLAGDDPAPSTSPGLIDAPGLGWKTGKLTKATKILTLAGAEQFGVNDPKAYTTLQAGTVLRVYKGKFANGVVSPSKAGDGVDLYIAEIAPGPGQCWGAYQGDKVPEEIKNGTLDCSKDPSTKARMGRVVVGYDALDTTGGSSGTSELGEVAPPPLAPPGEGTPDQGGTSTKSKFWDTTIPQLIPPNLYKDVKVTPYEDKKEPGGSSWLAILLLLGGAYLLTKKQ
jgi:hypothetical protein